MPGPLAEVHVSPECLRDVAAPSGANHAAALLERANCRFGVPQDPDAPDRCVLSVASGPSEAAAAHRAAAHDPAGRDTASASMVEPQKVLRVVGRFPER